MDLRRFTDSGTRSMVELLARWRTGEVVSSAALLTDPSSTTMVAEDAMEPPPVFSTRLELAVHVQGLVDPHVAGRSDLIRDEGLWSWLSILYIDSICPKSASGTRSPRADHKYVLSADRRTRYRHMVRACYLARSIHGDSGAFLLAGRASVFSEVQEQFMSRQDLFSSKAMMALCSRYYTRKKPDGSIENRTGASARNKGGTSRRLARVAQQMKRTYDIHGLTAKGLDALLPDEFDLWRT